jgi:hypothetical protein
MFGIALSLTRIEKDLIKTGRFQILSGRTRQGRRIAFSYAVESPKGVTGTNLVSSSPSSLLGMRLVSVCKILDRSTVLPICKTVDDIMI